MAAIESEFTIQGLKEFQLALKNLGGSLPKSLREYNIKAATDIVERARGNADTPQQRKAAESLRASKSSSYVAVLLGNNGRYAFARGAEWGARKYKQFPPWRGNQWRSWEGGPGYFLHPAIREVGQTVLEKYWESIRALRAEAFPD